MVARRVRGDADGWLLGDVADVCERDAMEKKVDVRRSRRDRLASIPPDHLLVMGRGWAFDGGHNLNVVRDQSA